MSFHGGGRWEGELIAVKSVARKEGAIMLVHNWRVTRLDDPPTPP